VGGQLGRHGARLDDRDPDVGQQLLPQRLRPAVEAPLRRRVHPVSGACDAARDGGDIYDVAAAGGDLVEEDLGRGDRAEQVHLDHAPVVLALLRGERPEQHDAGVVDQDVDAAEFLPDAAGGRDQRVAVRHVSLDRQGTVPELLGKRRDPVYPPGEQRHAVAVGGQGARLRRRPRTRRRW
jgi:hypothetical protein